MPQWNSTETIPIDSEHLRERSSLGPVEKQQHLCIFDGGHQDLWETCLGVEKHAPKTQWAIVRLSHIPDLEQVSAGPNVSTRTVQRVLAHFNAYGTVPNEDDEPARRDRSRNRHLPRDMDERPVGLILDSAPTARSSSDQQNNVPMEQPGGFQVGYGYPAPIFVLPQWESQGTGPSSQGTAPSNQQVQLGYSAPAPQNVARSISPALLEPVPKLEECGFAHLDAHAGRNPDGAVYSRFGPILREKGLYRLNHLDRKYVRISDLQDWLGIDVGTAMDIFGYAEEDRAAAKAGTLVLSDFLFF